MDDTLQQCATSPSRLTHVADGATDGDAVQPRIELRADVGGHPRCAGVGNAFSDVLDLRADVEAVGQTLCITEAGSRRRPRERRSTETLTKGILISSALDLA